MQKRPTRISTARESRSLRCYPTEWIAVLEIGCGAGTTLKWLRTQRSVQYAVGIDLSPEAAERAKSIFDVVWTGDIETMELPTGPFDLVLALDVLEHLVDPWLMMKRLQATLGPGPLPPIFHTLQNSPPQHIVRIPSLPTSPVPQIPPRNTANAMSSSVRASFSSDQVRQVLPRAGDTCMPSASPRSRRHSCVLRSGSLAICTIGQLAAARA